MSELTSFLYTWTPIFALVIIGVVGGLKYAAIRGKITLDEIKYDRKKKKESESFAGSINEMIDSAPKNLQQIESEIATIEQKGKDEGMSPDQIKKLTERLNSERDMLKMATKYGHIIKPLGGTVGRLAEKFLGGIGQ